MNQLLLIGRLTKEPELLNSQGATSYLRNSIAIKKTQKNENGDYDTDFYNFVAFGKTAEYLTQYCPKGTLILLKGHLSVGKITTEKGNIQTNDIICDNIEILSKPQNQQTAQVETPTSIINEYNKFQNEEQKKLWDSIGVKDDIDSSDLPF